MRSLAAGKKLFILAWALMLTSMSWGFPAIAQWKPTAPIVIMVPAGAGGGSDQTVRQLVKSINKIEPSVTFVVENYPGGGGATGFTAFMSRAPDGYTFLASYGDLVRQIVDKTLPFSLEDIVPVINVKQAPGTLMARTNDPRFSNYDELMKYVKTSGKDTVIAVFNLSGFDDLTIRSIERKEGVKFKRVPYSDAGQRYAALLGGHVDLLAARVGDVSEFVKAGKVFPIFMNIEQPLPNFPKMSTFKQKGVAFDVTFWEGIWAKKGTPPEAIAYVHNLLKRALEEPGYKQYEADRYLDILPGYRSSADFGAYLQRERKVWEAIYAAK